MPKNYTPLNNDLKYKVADFSTRFAAYLIDLYIFNFITIFLSTLFSDNITSYLTKILFIFYLFYLVITTKFYGQTLGKFIFKIKIIREDNKQITWFTAIAREVLGKTISHIFLIGFLVALFNKKRKTFHDLLSNTVVIQNEPLNKIKKIISYLIIIFLPLIFLIFLLSFIFFKFSYDDKKQLLIESIQEKNKIINTVFLNSPHKKIKNLIIGKIEIYQNQIKSACKQQYFFKENCTLEELSNSNLKRIDEFLDDMIKDLYLSNKEK